jgi:hypothetical protein
LAEGQIQLIAPDIIAAIRRGWDPTRVARFAFRFDNAIDEVANHSSHVQYPTDISKQRADESGTT